MIIAMENLRCIHPLMKRYNNISYLGSVSSCYHREIHATYTPDISCRPSISPAARISYTTIFVPQRYFGRSHYLRDDKPSSQVEVTVQGLKEKSTVSPSPEPQESKAISPQTRKSLGTRIKEEILHYYHGFKLLFIDTRICTKYIWRLMNGKTLSRREHRQLIRTTGDLFRLVPFSVFIIIPFMEFLLPVALKLFPGMLPSTFETTNEKEAKMKKKLKVKLEMAKFLQETLDSMSVQGKGHKSESAKAFVECFEMIQKTGEYVSNESIMKFSKLFEDEITLDSLTRPQLMALCRLLEMQPFGSNNFLRFQLRMKLRTLVADDKIIQHEGVESLALWELQQACRTRGMRAYGLPTERLRQQLSQWLDLSLNEKVPPSLLLLSRTLFLPESIPAEEKLKATITTLPEEVATRTKAKIGIAEGKIDNITQFEITKSEEERIREDKKELELERQEKKLKEESLARQKAAEEGMRTVADEYTQEVQTADMDVIEHKSAESTVAQAKEIIGAKKQPDIEKIDDKDILIDTAPLLKDTKEEELTAEDISHVEEAMEILELKKKSNYTHEKEFEELKSEMKDYEEDLEDFKEAIEISGIDAKSLKESKAAQRLFSRVNLMIKKMEPVVEILSEKKETRQKIIDDSSSDDVKLQDRADLININELSEHIQNVISTSDSSKVEMIRSVLSRMDGDMDGVIKAEHVIKVLELISEDKVGVSPKIFEEVIEMMEKEEQLEAHQLVEMALEKLPTVIKDEDVNLDLEETLDKLKPAEASSISSDVSKESSPIIQEVVKLKSKEIPKPTKEV